jgi:hypothetical protein
MVFIYWWKSGVPELKSVWNQQIKDKKEFLRQEILIFFFGTQFYDDIDVLTV